MNRSNTTTAILSALSMFNSGIAIGIQLGKSIERNRHEDAATKQTMCQPAVDAGVDAKETDHE